MSTSEPRAASSRTPRRRATPGEYVTFTLGAEEYAVPVACVREIISYAGFTRIPNLADFVAGVIDLRGAVVPVVDARVKFGLERPEYDKYTVILIVEVAGRLLGVIVDRVTDVAELGADQMRPTGALGGAIGARFVLGMAERDDHLAVLLDIDRLLSDEELAAVDQSAL